MSTILFAWELGGGLGHLMQMRPIAHGLLARGHRIAAALKDLFRARQVFGPDVPLLQAPIPKPPATNPSGRKAMATNHGRAGRAT